MSCAGRHKPATCSPAIVGSFDGSNPCWILRAISIPLDPLRLFHLAGEPAVFDDRRAHRRDGAREAKIARTERLGGHILFEDQTADGRRLAWKRDGHQRAPGALDRAREEVSLAGIDGYHAVFKDRPKREADHGGGRLGGSNRRSSLEPPQDLRDTSLRRQPLDGDRADAADRVGRRAARRFVVGSRRGDPAPLRAHGTGGLFEQLLQDLALFEDVLERVAEAVEDVDLLVALEDFDRQLLQLALETRVIAVGAQGDR